MDKSPVKIITTSEGENEDPIASTTDKQELSTKFKMPSSSFLGADLQASKDMPPPKLNVVKKSRILINPGKSMIEWMRFQTDQSTSGTVKLRKIGLDELSTHNQPGDVWMALNDKVYDVSDYARYHPGGVEEMMKGAGQDATEMFNQVHRWVNFESILKRKLLGYLVRQPTLALLNKVLTQQNSMELESPKLNSQLVPTTKFSEDDDSLFFEVDSETEGDMREECWTVGVLNRERFLLKVIIKPPDLWMTHLKLLQSLQDDQINVSFQNNFKRLLIKLKKPEKERWKALGAPLAENNKLLDSRGALEDMYPAKLIRKERLTHNVYLFTLQVAQSAFIGVPVGFHLKIRINGVCRKYTPASQSLIEIIETTESKSTSQELYFIIKVYPDGGLTRQLDNLPMEGTSNSLEIGCPGGSFTTEFLHGIDTLCLLAAGSGITPFVRIIQYLHKRKIAVPIKRIILVFFNETTEDIIWNNEFKKLAEILPSWFYFYPVISKGTDEWKGLRGRISSELLEKCVLQSLESTTIPDSPIESCKAAVCGSYGFNDACKQALRQQKLMKIEEPKGVYVFTG